MATVETRKQWNNTFKILEKKIVQNSTYSQSISEVKGKMFLDIQDLKQILAHSPLLRDLLEDVVHQPGSRKPWYPTQEREKGNSQDNDEKASQIRGWAAGLEANNADWKEGKRTLAGMDPGKKKS